MPPPIAPNGCFEAPARLAFPHFQARHRARNQLQIGATLKDEKDITELIPEPPRALPPAVPVWMWPAVMLVLTAIAFAGARFERKSENAMRLS